MPLYYPPFDEEDSSYKNKSLISFGTEEKFEKSYLYGNQDRYAGGVSEIYSVGAKSGYSIGLRKEFEQTDLFKDRNEYSGTYRKSQSEIKFTYPSYQILDSTSYEPRGSAGIVNSGCVLLKDHNEYANGNFKLETKAKENFKQRYTDGTIIETEYNSSCELGIFEQKAEIDYELSIKDTDGTVSKVECGASCELGSSEKKAKINYESSIKQDNYTFFQNEGSLEANIETKGEKLGAKIGSTVFKVRDEDNDASLTVLKATASTESSISKDGIKEMVRTSINLVETQLGAFGAKLGVSLDTGLSIDKNCVEVNFEGFGLKIGKEIGLNTPFGAVSLDLEKLS